MNICWCRKVCFVFQPGSRRGKVRNLIKPSSGGASLIRDPPNKRRVPRENNIYMLQHGPSLHLDSCSARGREPPYWKQLRRFKSGPRQRSPAQRRSLRVSDLFPCRFFAQVDPKCKSTQDTLSMLMRSYVSALYLSNNAIKRYEKEYFSIIIPHTFRHNDKWC